MPDPTPTKASTPPSPPTSATPTPASPSTPPPAAAGRQAKVGDTVRVVLGDGTSTTAQVTKVHKNGNVDLSFMHRNAAVEICSSPCDATGLQPDSWNFVD